VKKEYMGIRCIGNHSLYQKKRPWMGTEKKPQKTGDFSSRTRRGMEKQMLGMVVIRNWRMSTSEARK